ncbi:MAG: hypothetical protein IKV97_00185 [Clostridia bacterium]|nr:hypothetical protein [Clostridia bacterium]
MNKKLLILGAGQYSFVARDIAIESGYGKISFLDDCSELAIGKLWDFPNFADEYKEAFVAIGNASLRLELTEKLTQCGFRAANLISPKAFVSPSAHLEFGIAIEPMAVVQANAFIGTGTIISSGAVIRHNAILGKCCHADCGCIVPSDCRSPTKPKSPAEQFSAIIKF